MIAARSPNLAGEIGGRWKGNLHTAICIADHDLCPDYNIVALDD